MKNIEFGQLLEKLLYLSNQKKITLAKELGYDISYISKWINGRNLPTQKSISSICKVTSEFIVKSLNPISKQDLKHYFEIEVEIEDDTELAQYINRSLKESYMITAQKSDFNIYKSTQSEEYYNSILHINPRLRKQYLSNDTDLYVNKSSKLDIILSTNLYKLKSNDKVYIADMKSSLAEIQKDNEVRVRFLTGFEGNEKDTILNTFIIIYMIITYTDLNFEVYNCNVDNSNIVSVMKDRIFHSAIFASNGRCLFTNMSKEKSIVDEAYYSLEEIIKDQGKLLVEKKPSIDILKEKIYMQYIMGRDLRWILGSMNEFFMPSDLFMELAENLFGQDEEVLKELRQINTFLQNIIYKSNIKVLIYEPELMRYISTGEVTFFNIPIKLTLDQMERHIKNIEQIIRNHDEVEIKFIENNILDDFNPDLKPSIYLSKNLKLIKMSPGDEFSDYAVVKDFEFNKVCDGLFDKSWNTKTEKFISEKGEILDRISKALIYARIISGEIN